MTRLDVLFPECCRVCDHYHHPSGRCDHELVGSLVDHFVADPDSPCPVREASLGDAPPAGEG